MAAGEVEWKIMLNPYVEPKKKKKKVMPYSLRVGYFRCKKYWLPHIGDSGYTLNLIRDSGYTLNLIRSGIYIILNNYTY